MSNELTTEQLESLLATAEKARDVKAALAVPCSNGAEYRATSSQRAAITEWSRAFDPSTCIALVRGLIEQREHRCPHFQPKGEDSGGAYNAQIIWDVTQELVDPGDRERMAQQPTWWYSRLIKQLIQRVANLRVMLIEKRDAPEGKARLTPQQCANQFRMYAKAHSSADAIHQLNFCADFLDEFCTADVSCAGTDDAQSVNDVLCNYGRRCDEDAKKFHLAGFPDAALVAQAKANAAMDIIRELSDLRAAQPDSKER